MINQLEFIRDLFQMLGLLINNKKSQLEPSQEIVFLGLAISTISMKVSLSKEKVTKIQREAKHLHSKSEVSIQNLATFVGMTTVAKQAIRVAPLFHRHLQALINRVVPLASSIEEVKQSYHQMIEMSVEATQKLGVVDARNAESQWSSFTNGSTRSGDRVRCISPGLGSNLEKQRAERTGGQWSTSEQEIHINCLELLAASLAIQTFTKEMKNRA